MKILLANQTLAILAGSETWVLTLAAELVKQGHKVTGFSPQLGFIATKMEAMGIKCVDSIGTSGERQIKPFSIVLEEETDENFDVIICNHHDITAYLHQQLPNVPIIATVHGILHTGPNGEIYPEHPVTDFKVDQYISVSEEVQDKLKEEYGIESIIIRNFFDLERFKKEEKLPEKISNFLVNSNYWGKDDVISKTIKEVSTHYGAHLLAVGANFEPNSEVEDVIKQVDVVVGMGRSVFEGACMGKLALIHGRWGTGGVLTPESYEELKKTNFSGRLYRQNMNGNCLADSDDIIKNIDANFNQKNVDEVYKLVKKNHDVKKAAKQFIEIAESLIAKKNVK